ncbi:hypothetical protein [Rhodopirellula halodulae]|nr:hypothetical protein [Rhodopirellula sp. JC737]MCC9654886.1 hypothetical protein [Rhodopirellula sp. JC737]
MTDSRSSDLRGRVLQMLVGRSMARVGHATRDQFCRDAQRSGVAPVDK